MNFKVGDRVKVYGQVEPKIGYYLSAGKKGIVTYTGFQTEISVKLDDGESHVVHPKQCRKLVKRGIKLSKPSKDWNLNPKGITGERYRQMKLKLKRRWEQVEELEKELSRCATEIHQVVDLANLESQTKPDIQGWLQYLYDYWKKYE